PEVHVAPVLGVLRLAGPQVGDAHAAGEPDPPVHHQQLAVGAIVHATQVVPVERTVTLDLDPGVFHLVQQRLIHLDTADPVDRDVDRDAGAGALGQRRGELLADLPGPVDVGLESDRHLRAAD